MNIYFYKPITPGFRGKSKIFCKLYKGKLDNKLLKKLKDHSGRNNLGRITIRHRGGGVKRKYRIIDFYRKNTSFYAKVGRIEYDPYRNCNIAFVNYSNGKKGYIIAPKSIKVNDVLLSSDTCPIKLGNSLLLKNIPEGTKIHCIENFPGGGFKYSRSSGSFSVLVSKGLKYANILLKSGVLKKVNLFCRATIGEVGNSQYNLIKKGKAGVNRLKGIRPTVRGVAMNPIDHPHGGGEGKTSGGRDPVSPWGMPTKGYKTK